MFKSSKVRADGTSELTERFEALDDPEFVEKAQKLLLDAKEQREAKARYKLEVMFLEDRSMTKPHLGVVLAWTNGGFMNGGGDESVYFCPTRKEGGEQCYAPIDIRLLVNGLAVCSKCGRAHNPMDLTGQIRARLRTQQWAELMTRMFYRLESNADLRVGHFRGDLRAATELEMTKPQKGEAVSKVYRDRLWVTYSLQDLIQDVHSGSDVYKRIKSFLSA